VLLERLLRKLDRLESIPQILYSIVVVDNDLSQSARTVVEEFSRASRLSTVYGFEPEQNISLARNRSVNLANGELIAFIDDDEFPSSNWLVALYRTLVEHEADAVLGPVKPHLTPAIPDWLVKSKVLERREYETGYQMRDHSQTRTGNVLIRKNVFESSEDYFDPEYGRSGGGDAMFFKRAINKGKKIVWCNEAIVYEEVPPERCTSIYYFRRACTRGLTTAWEVPFLSINTIKSILAVILYTISLPFSLLLGRHLFFRLLVKSFDHGSKLLAYFGVKLVSQRPY